MIDLSENEPKLSKTTNMMIKSSELGELQEWKKWTKEIPSFPFKEHWRVKVIPPHTGAVVRFLVYAKADTDEKHPISVYLDCYDVLGLYGKPYWEVYPVEGDIQRVSMNSIEELIQVIDNALYDEVCRI